MTSSKADIGYIYYENNTTDQMLWVKTILTDHQGIEFEPTLKEGNIIKVKPGWSYAYVFPYITRKGAGFKFSYQFQFLPPDAGDEEQFELPPIVEEENKKSIKNN